VLVLTVPVFDAALVSVSRVRRGLSPFSSPGTDHTAHRLAARLGQRRAVVALYAVGAVGGALAVALLQVGPKAATFLVLVAAVLGAAALVLLERGFATD
jgi:UDP-GlcNAc:undecaprenyl-phosphate GlcNAc-1-phosphate transferase